MNLPKSDGGDCKVAKRRGLRCRLGFHDYRYVGFRWVEDGPGLKSGHSHECGRCSKQIYWATGIVNEGDGSPLTKAAAEIERLL